ncbi:hypothetical protein J4G37_11710 [Microvirga sp. 3-52]|nr:hypothetical protein [Microvirga sp. 3-52]
MDPLPLPGLSRSPAGHDTVLGRTRFRPTPAFVTPSAVMAGLDPAIPMLRGAALQASGSPAQGR